MKLDSQIAEAEKNLKRVSTYDTIAVSNGVYEQDSLLSRSRLRDDLDISIVANNITVDCPKSSNANATGTKLSAMFQNQEVFSLGGMTETAANRRQRSMQRIIIFLSLSLVVFIIIGCVFIADYERRENARRAMPIDEILVETGNSTDDDEHFANGNLTDNGKQQQHYSTTTSNYDFFSTATVRTDAVVKLSVFPISIGLGTNDGLVTNRDRSEKIPTNISDASTNRERLDLRPLNNSAVEISRAHNNRSANVRKPDEAARIEESKAWKLMTEAVELYGRYFRDSRSNPSYNFRRDFPWYYWCLVQRYQLPALVDTKVRYRNLYATKIFDATETKVDSMLLIAAIRAARLPFAERVYCFDLDDTILFTTPVFEHSMANATSVDWSLANNRYRMVQYASAKSRVIDALLSLSHRGGSIHIITSRGFVDPGDGFHERHDEFELLEAVSFFLSRNSGYYFDRPDPDSSNRCIIYTSPERRGNLCLWINRTKRSTSAIIDSDKSELIRSLDCSFMFGDSDDDMASCLAANKNCRPIRVLRSEKSSYTRSYNPGMFGEIVLIDTTSARRDERV